MGEPHHKEHVTLDCPKCRILAGELKKGCPACGGTGKLTLKKLAKQRKHDEPGRNWQDELKKRGLLNPDLS